MLLNVFMLLFANTTTTIAMNALNAFKCLYATFANTATTTAMDAPDAFNCLHATFANTATTCFECYNYYSNGCSKCFLKVLRYFC